MKDLKDYKIELDSDKSIFNKNNTSWETGKYPLFLGDSMALLDSIATNYPKLFDLYKLQKSMDWSEDEVNLQQSRQDLLSTTQNNYDIMVKTLAFQWELDSTASRAIAPLFSPFISNSELWMAYSKISDMENLHSLTYSEIIRQCVADPQEVYKEVMHSDEVLNRSVAVIEAFNALDVYGSKYKLGLVDKDDRGMHYAILKALIALLCLEGIEFMASFACTFALAEQNIFMGIAKLVQKIMLDENVHVMVGKEVLGILLHNEQNIWTELFEENKEDLTKMVVEVIEQELSWNSYIFSEGRSIVGLNKVLLDEWVLWKSQEIMEFLRMDNPYEKIKTNPLRWMDNWEDLNKKQNANQEGDNTNYRLNAVKDDSEDVVFEL